MNHFNRRQRRQMLRSRGILGLPKDWARRKQRINLTTQEVTPGLKDWGELLRENIRSGNLRHRQYVENQQKQMSERFAIREATIRENLSKIYEGDQLNQEMMKIVEGWKLWPKWEFHNVEDPYETQESES